VGVVVASLVEGESVVAAAGVDAADVDDIASDSGAGSVA